MRHREGGGEEEGWAQEREGGERETGKEGGGEESRDKGKEGRKARGWRCGRGADRGGRNGCMRFWGW